MRYVLYVTFPSSYHSTTIHMQYIDDLSTLHNLIKEWSLDDNRYEFEIVPVKERPMAI